MPVSTTMGHIPNNLVIIMRLFIKHCG